MISVINNILYYEFYNFLLSICLNALVGFTKHMLGFHMTSECIIIHLQWIYICTLGDIIKTIMGTNINKYIDKLFNYNAKLHNAYVIFTFIIFIIELIIKLCTMIYDSIF